MFSRLRRNDFEISTLVEVMHVFGGACILFINKVSAIIDERCSMGSAGVRIAGRFSTGRGGAVAGCDGGHG